MDSRPTVYDITGLSLRNEGILCALQKEVMFGNANFQCLYVCTVCAFYTYADAESREKSHATATAVAIIQFACAAMLATLYCIAINGNRAKYISIQRSYL